MSEILLHEVEFHVSFEGSYQYVIFEAYDKDSTVDGVVCRFDYDSEGKRVDLPTLLIRDRGHPNSEPTCPRYAVVVRRMGRATPIPQDAGRFVGRFATENGAWEWYVFAPRPGVSPRPAESVHQRGRAPKPAPYAHPSPAVESPPLVLSQDPGSGAAAALFGMEE